MLEIEELTKIYDDGTVAVEDVSFTVDDGEFCVLIGPSGCGKSTTLHSIVGKTTPTEGRIFIDGDDVTDVPTHRRDIGLVFQDFQLFPHLTVEENVRYGPERMGLEEEEIERRVDDALELMRIQGERERDTEALSAGQRQRVALARSLVLEPSLLLLDEPLGDLDYKLQKVMERELMRIHRELETTFVYVTHDQNQAMRLGEKVAVMNSGRLEQVGSVDEVFDEPATAFVATFVGDSNVFHGTLASRYDGEAEVEAGYGRYTTDASNAPDAEEGDDVVLVVRPHSLRADADAENTLECRLVDVLHRPGLGSQLVFEPVGGGDRYLTMSSYNRMEPDREDIVVGWDAEDSILLDRTSVVDDVDLERDVLGE